MSYHMYNKRQEKFLVAGEVPVNGIRPIYLVKKDEINSNNYGVWTKSPNNMAGFALTIVEIDASIVPAGSPQPNERYPLYLAGMEYLPPLTFANENGIIRCQNSYLSSTGAESVYLIPADSAGSVDTWEFIPV